MDTFQQGSPTELWQSLVLEGERKRNLALGEELESYLVFTLMRHLGDSALATRSMALDWLRAIESTDPTKDAALREVGDRCLLIAGLFPKLAERCRVDDQYFCRLGRGAYANAAERANRPNAFLFARLVEAFHSLVAVLRAIGPDARNRRIAFAQRRPVCVRDSKLHH